MTALTCATTTQRLCAQNRRRLSEKALFAGTVRDNIRFGKQDATDEEIWQALETAQAKQMIEDKSGQLDFVLEQEGKISRAVSVKE